MWLQAARGRGKALEQFKHEVKATDKDKLVSVTLTIEEWESIYWDAEAHVSYWAAQSEPLEKLWSAIKIMKGEE